MLRNGQIAKKVFQGAKQLAVSSQNGPFIQTKMRAAKKRGNKSLKVVWANIRPVGGTYQDDEPLETLGKGVGLWELRSLGGGGRSCGNDPDISAHTRVCLLRPSAHWGGEKQNKHCHDTQPVGAACVTLEKPIQFEPARRSFQKRGAAHPDRATGVAAPISENELWVD